MRCKSLADVRHAGALATHAWRLCIPINAAEQQIANILADANLEFGLPYDELRQREFELGEAHALALQLATLAATEGCIRSLAAEWVAHRSEFSTEKLRNLLGRYHLDGLPDRFRSLVEAFAAAVSVPKKQRATWDRLLDYRNWLAHGRCDELPRQKVPSRIDLDQVIDRAVASFRRAIGA